MGSSTHFPSPFSRRHPLREQGTMGIGSFSDGRSLKHSSHFFSVFFLHRQRCIHGTEFSLFQGGFFSKDLVAILDSFSPVLSAANTRKPDARFFFSSGKPRAGCRLVDEQILHPRPIALGTTLQAPLSTPAFLGEARSSATRAWQVLRPIELS